MRVSPSAFNAMVKFNAIRISSQPNDTPIPWDRPPRKRQRPEIRPALKAAPLPVNLEDQAQAPVASRPRRGCRGWTVRADVQVPGAHPGPGREGHGQVPRPRPSCRPCWGHGLCTASAPGPPPSPVLSISPGTPAAGPSSHIGEHCAGHRPRSHLGRWGARGGPRASISA